MSDMGDVYKAIRTNNKQRKEDNRKSSAQMLTDAGIDFVSNNNGVHLMIDVQIPGSGQVQRIDFWPGTGKWKTMGQVKHGVKPLIMFIKDVFNV